MPLPLQIEAPPGQFPPALGAKPPRKTQDDRFVEPEQLGLKCLYEPPKTSAGKTTGVDVDVVAVHGLGAHPDWSWVDPISKVDWIKDANMLPSLIPKARILRYGYYAKWFGEDPVKSRLHDMAEALLHELKSEPDRQKYPKRPLIFICHCFGGLIVENALCVARMDKTTFPEIFKAYRGIVLMGTPHRGTGKFTSEELMLRIINAEIPFELSAPDVLKPNNETLVSLVEDFTKLINDPNVRDRLKIFCFFEQISTTASDVLKNVVNNARLDRSIVKEFVVDRDSATLIGYNRLGFQLNHFHLNKFSSPDNVHYQQVKNVIVDMVKHALASPASSQKPLVRNPSVHGAALYRPPLSIPPYEKDRGFQGRRYILERMTKKLSKPESHRVVLHGPAGSGKSHIAIQYAHTYAEKGSNRRVFWIASRTFEEFERAYIKLGNDLAILGIRDVEKDPLVLVQSHLSDETQGSWLMVLDGADNLDSKDLKRMMDCIPSSPLGAILATTCKRPLANKLALKSADVLDVTAFTIEDTIHFFRRELTEERISDDEIRDLCKLLKGLPIAIVQAASYLTACPNTSAQEYLQDLRSCKPKTVDSGILATTQISFNHIIETTPYAADLARKLSVFDFQTVPIFVLRYYDSKVKPFCSLMSKFALIGVTIDQGQVSLSQLVRSTIKDMTVENETLSDILSEEFLVPFGGAGKAAFSPSCEILLPYAQAALKLQPTPTTDDGQRCRANLLFNTASYNAHVRRYEPAIQALKESVQLRERETPPDSKLVNETKAVLRDIELLAKSSKRASITPKKLASPKIDHLLEQARIFIGPKQQDEVEKELVMYSKALQVAGKGDSISAKKADDALAILYDNHGQHEKAITKHENVLEWCKQNYGAHNLHTYRQVYKIALNLDLRGMYEKAESQYRVAWEGTKACLGEDHPEASRILCNLATVISKQGKRRDAKAGFDDALLVQAKLPGPQHADTLMTKHNYAIYMQGEETEDNLSKAGELLEEVLRGQEAILGPDHLDTLRTAHNLAANFWAGGKDETALALCRLVFPRLVEKLGAFHPDTMATKMLMERIQALE